MSQNNKSAALSLVALDLEGDLSNPTTRRAALLALDALETGAVYRDWLGDIVVKSATKSGVEYVVWGSWCSCPARKACWHLQAAEVFCLFESYVDLLAAAEQETEQDAPIKDAPPIQAPALPPSPFPHLKRYRRDAGKLAPRSRTIKEDQARLGAHLQRVLYERPHSATIH